MFEIFNVLEKYHVLLSDLTILRVFELKINISAAETEKQVPQDAWNSLLAGFLIKLHNSVPKGIYAALNTNSNHVLMIFSVFFCLIWALFWYLETFQFIIFAGISVVHNYQVLKTFCMVCTVCSHTVSRIAILFSFLGFVKLLVNLEFRTECKHYALKPDLMFLQYTNRQTEWMHLLLLKLMVCSLCVLDRASERRPSIPAPARETRQETRKTIHIHRGGIPKVPGGILF